MSAEGRVLGGSSSGWERRVSRYAVVTVVATPANLVLLIIVMHWTSLPSVAASLLAAALVSIPSYVACARWVWRERSATAGHRRRAAAFWASTMVNVGVATLAVHIVDRVWSSSRTVVSVVPTSVYAMTWLFRFLWLEHRVFSSARVCAESVLEFGADDDESQFALDTPSHLMGEQIASGDCSPQGAP